MRYCPFAFKLANNPRSPVTIDGERVNTPGYQQHGKPTGGRCTPEFMRHGWTARQYKPSNAMKPAAFCLSIGKAT
jgi:hypothetical protein